MTKLRPSKLPRYFVKAALLAARSLPQTSISQLALMPPEISVSISGTMLPGVISAEASPAPCEVYRPTFSTPRPPPAITEGRNAPCRICTLFCAISMSCKVINTSGLLRIAVSMSAMRFLSLKKSRQFICAELVVSVALL